MIDLTKELNQAHFVTALVLIAVSLIYIAANIREWLHLNKKDYHRKTN